MAGHLKILGHSRQNVGKSHDDVIKWKYFPLYWPFVRGIHRWPVNSPHRGQWRGALMFSFICARIKGWVNNREAGDLRRHHAHYDVIVIMIESIIYARDWHLKPLRQEKMTTILQASFFKCISLDVNVWIAMNISLKCVPKGPINNIPALVQTSHYLNQLERLCSEDTPPHTHTHSHDYPHYWIILDPKSK